jgi:hypothetical protein
MKKFILLGFTLFASMTYGQLSLPNGTSNITSTTNSATGFIGIGTNTPSRTLDIQNNTSPGTAVLNLRNINPTGPTWMVFQADVLNQDASIWKSNSSFTSIGSGPYSWNFWQTGNYPISFFTNSVNRFHIAGDGNVGIGISTNPVGYKLAVVGKIIAEELKIQLRAQWPDYVFSKEYKLPTLKEVEKQIEEKGHLLNVPSACEIETNGFEVGDMARIQQQKIEELTLYIIELSKRLEAQDKKMQILEAKISN